tara:strand:- start:10040 stop:10351 length:312 start_codon:yes stop_codon:yes gene_type:complete
MKQWIVNRLLKLLHRPNMSNIDFLEQRFLELQKQNEKEQQKIAEAKAEQKLLLEEQKEFQAKLEERGIEDLDEAQKECDKLENEIINEIMAIEAQMEIRTDNE